MYGYHMLARASTTYVELSRPPKSYSMTSLGHYILYATSATPCIAAFEQHRVVMMPSSGIGVHVWAPYMPEAHVDSW
jgi:hypothetical protein